MLLRTRSPLCSRVHVGIRHRVAVSCADADSRGGGDVGQSASVSGLIYQSPSGPTVQLFTKAGCTLCDKAKEVLADIAKEQPHALEAVDITDPDKRQWWDKYKYDIPVLHINGKYWAKHRITIEESLDALGTPRQTCQTRVPLCADRTTVKAMDAATRCTTAKQP